MILESYAALWSPGLQHYEKIYEINKVSNNLPLPDRSALKINLEAL